MSQAYQQVELDESSRQFTIINTHKGLFEYTRLPFGISLVPAVFQQVMEGLLQDIPGVVVLIDDVLVTGKTNEDHLESLETVLKRMEEAGMLLKEKCYFMTKSVSYLGYTIDEDGLHCTKEKLQAIQDVPSPKNVTQLKSYLGLLSYYGRFSPNLSNVLFPLYRLLRKQTPWKWSITEEETFQNSEKVFMSSKLQSNLISCVQVHSKWLAKSMSRGVAAVSEMEVRVIYLKWMYFKRFSATTRKKSIIARITSRTSRN